jgi:hypothetical protein
MDLPFPTPSLFTAKGPFEAPDWVPVCVPYQAELDRHAVWEPPLTKEGEETIRRLLTDERMRTVWTEFFKNKRSRLDDEAHDYVHEPICELKDIVTLSGWTTQDLAAMKYFSKAVLLAISPGRLLAVAECRGFARLLTKGAQDLREVERLFHAGLGFGDADDEEDIEWDYVKDLEKIALYLDKLAKHYSSMLQTDKVIQRVRGDGQVRGFVVRLSHLTKDLFGKPLYRTLATTATVALDRAVGAERVREILSGG